MPGVQHVYACVSLCVCVCVRALYLLCCLLNGELTAANKAHRFGIITSLQSTRYVVIPCGCKWIHWILTPSNTWFFATQVCQPPYCISISSAIFAQLTHVLNTQTQHL